ncbi:MAG: DEAD/DEAH box helicase family protein [Clostridia bacterium]|nr:DEAD/DEAH box helicase family protein [Clostridia bacterium]
MKSIVPPPEPHSLSDVLCENIRNNSENPARLYRGLEVDGSQIDIMEVDGSNIVGYLVVDGPKEMGEALSRVPVYDSVCDAVFLAARNVPARQQAYFPPNWGRLKIDRTGEGQNAEVREISAGEQLELLTDAELADFDARTATEEPSGRKRKRRTIIREISKRFGDKSLSASIIGYLMRRGTALDTVNPGGSVPEASAADFTRPVTEDAGVLDALGLGQSGRGTTKAAQDAQPKHMNRAQRRAAARAAEAAARRAAKAKENTPKTAKRPGKSVPSATIMALFNREVAKPPNTSFRITDDMISELEEYNPYLAEMLDDASDALNEIARRYPIPHPPAVEAGPNVPEIYTRRRRFLAELQEATTVYLDHARYNHTWLIVRQLQDMLQSVLAEPDREVGPDTTEHNVLFDDIVVRPGVPWLPEDLISEFADYLQYGGPAPWFAGPSQIVYTPSTGSWTLRSKYVAYDSPGSVERLESQFGIPEYNGLKVLESLLNLQQPKFQSEDKTAVVMEKQEAVLDEFRSWLGRDPWRRWTVEESYNKFFNNYKGRTFDGSKLRFPGLSDEVELYPYQKDAVAQIMEEKNTLLAFDVGAGKTYIMAAAAMNMRASKKSPKNLFVVPNNIVGQWERIFHTMYPQAKLLVVEPKTFTPARRNDVLRDIRDNDYDGIIMAYSSFDLIRLSIKEIRRQRKAAEAAIQKDIAKYSRSDTAVSKTRQYLRSVETEATAVARSLAPKNNEITLDELGITTLFLDEAHNFKNVPIRSSLKNVAGINLKGSQKNLNMLYKVRAIQNNRKRGGVVFATGTPLSNSLADCYTMQKYLQPKMLQETHLDVFDNWLKSFAKPEYVCEIDVDTSKFRYVNRLSRFYNLPELSHLFASNAAFYALEDDDSLPELRGYTNILIPENKNLRKYMDELCTRTEKIRAGLVPPFIDNMLLISTDGRKAALDLRLVGRRQPDDETSKVFCCAREVMKIYRADPNYTQIVFCDYSTPKGDQFSVYADLKKHLIRAGVPPEEIAFVHSATTEAKKLELYEKVNSGEIRVLIGSTFKLGIGANVQTKLKAIHHLDIPWRPADMVQREGRILRKGNTNDEVQIFRYITEGSFDAYAWQILESKQKFISQFLTGSTYERSASDLEDTVLTYAQVKALAINEPLMKTLAEKQNELRRIRLLASNYVQTQDTRRGGMDQLLEDERKLRKFSDITQENADYLAGLETKQFTEAYKAIAEVFSPAVLSGEEPLPESAQDILGFKAELPPAEDRNPKKPVLWLSRSGARYPLVMGDKTAGNARRIVNFLKRFDIRAEKARQRADAAKQRIEGNENALQGENPYPAQIEKLSAEIQKLQDQILSRQVERGQEALQTV